MTYIESHMSVHISKEMYLIHFLLHNKTLNEKNLHHYTVLYKNANIEIYIK